MQCDEQEQALGNLNEHAKRFHANESLFLIIQIGELLLVSCPNNHLLPQTLYQNAFGQNIELKSSDWEK